MSLRWTSYAALKPPKEAQQRKTAVFQRKSHFGWRKSATKFLCVKTVRHSLAYLSLQKWLVGFPLYVKIWRILTHPYADFQSIFARSVSAVTASEKSSINTTRKSTMRFPISVRWIVYVDPKPPKGAIKRSVQNLNNNLR